MPKQSKSIGHRRQSNADEPRYEVGYGKPPVNTRFKPGRSGNPGGRPKGTKKGANRIAGSDEERMKEVIREEAYRKILVRDGDRFVEIPTIQAIFRSIALNAVKGNQRAQRMIVDLVQSVEREDKFQYDEFVRAAIEYKAYWEHELARRERFGETGPEPLPHPDDIIVNLKTGEVEIRGPMTKEDKVLWDRLRLLKEECDEENADLEERSAKNPDDRSIEKEIAYQRRLRKRITKFIPD